MSLLRSFVGHLGGVNFGGGPRLVVAGIACYEMSGAVGVLDPVGFVDDLSCFDGVAREAIAEVHQLGDAALHNLAIALGDELEVEGVHVAMVTVNDFVRPGARLEPGAVAESYWTLYTQDPLNRQREIVLR